MAIEPPILKKIESLRVLVEKAVARFARDHRYAIGDSLRKEIHQVARLANRAWRDPDRVGHWTEQLVWAVDEFKQSLQVAKELKALASFRQFEELVLATEELGRQCGGWKRQHKADHPIGQNAPDRSVQGQRAQTLSTSGASPRGQA